MYDRSAHARQRPARERPGQTRRQSLTETVITYVVGYTTSVALQVLIFPLFGIVLLLRQNAIIGVIFYGVAIGRAYLLRRMFSRFSGLRGQSRLHSGLESFVNTAVGYLTTVVLQLLVFPMFGVQPKLSHNMTIAVIFYVIAFVRLYLLRRFFNWLWP